MYFLSLIHLFMANLIPTPSALIALEKSIPNDLGQRLQAQAISVGQDNTQKREITLGFLLTQEAQQYFKSIGYEVDTDRQGSTLSWEKAYSLTR